MKNLNLSLSAIFAVFLFASCQSPYMVKHPVAAGDTYYLYVNHSSDKFNEIGNVEGETSQDDEMVCHARGFPLGTFLEIKSLESKKSVVVTVTGRPKENVVSLPKAVFEKIDNLNKSRVRARIKVVNKKLAKSYEVQKEEQIEDETKEEIKGEESKAVETNKFYSLELASFGDLESAKSYQNSVSAETYILKDEDAVAPYSVRFGRFSTKKEAEESKTTNFPNIDATIIEVTE